jgi:CheY-like chemotaxis protein
MWCAMTGRLPHVSNQSPRVLIVEDELLIAVMISEMVKGLGYRISATATNITMARQEFAEQNFDAVLLDVNLDGQDCTELADLLMERAVPFAFVTGYDYLVEPRHGKVPLLEKPFTPAQLGALLQTLVGSAASDEIPQRA